jgi:hypothetical protein
MTNVRIIKHEAIPQTGSYEVKFTDGRPSVYYYFDDDPGRVIRRRAPNVLGSPIVLMGMESTDLFPTSVASFENRSGRF